MIEKNFVQSRNPSFIEDVFSHFVPLINENLPGKTELYTKEAVRFFIDSSTPKRKIRTFHSRKLFISS